MTAAVNYLVALVLVSVLGRGQCVAPDPPPRYAGCFGIRVSHYESYRYIENITLDKCVNACRSLPKRYAGVVASFNACHCVDTLRVNYENKSASACNVLCPGDRLRACGSAEGLVSYYEISRTPLAVQDLTQQPALGQPLLTTQSTAALTQPDAAVPGAGLPLPDEDGETKYLSTQQLQRRHLVRDLQLTKLRIQQTELEIRVLQCQVQSGCGAKSGTAGAPSYATVSRGGL